VRELPVEPGLADAGLAADADDLAVAGTGARQGLGKLLELGRAPDEPGQPAGGRGLEARAPRPGTRQLVDLDGLAQAFDRDGAEGPDLDVALGEPQDAGGHEDRAGHSHLLHAGGEVSGLTDGGVVHAKVAADGANDDFAGVEADANLERDARGALDGLGVALDGLLHAEGRVTGADGVVLVGERRAKEGHDPVAHHLIDGALKPVHGFHHPLEDGVEELPGLLGIAVGEELHRALQVGEEDRDLLALALEGGLRGQDLLGEVLGGIGLRGVESLSRRRRGR
jgi:hypothetical protein